MAHLLYYLVLLPLSKLPLSALYRLSDAAYWVLYRGLGYRREVVFDNLRRSFPDWDEARVARQASDFYHYLFDTIVESVKNYSMSEAEARRRAVVVNPELLRPAAERGQSVLVVGAHYGNWEIGGLSFPSYFSFANVVAVYSPLKNAAMERLTKANRQRTGVTMVSRRVVYDHVANDPLNPVIDIFVADQSPSNAVWQKVHWTTFLGRPTGFLAGPERFAVRHDRPIYYINFRRTGRGHYAGELFPITETPRDVPSGFITEAFARRLEEEIRRDPTPWLWTHRRWKRPAPPEVVRRLATEPFLPAEYER